LNSVFRRDPAADRRAHGRAPQRFVSAGVQRQLIVGNDVRVGSSATAAVLVLISAVGCKPSDYAAGQLFGIGLSDWQSARRRLALLERRGAMTAAQRAAADRFRRLFEIAQ